MKDKCGSAWASILLTCIVVFEFEFNYYSKWTLIWNAWIISSWTSFWRTRKLWRVEWDSLSKLGWHRISTATVMLYADAVSQLNWNNSFWSFCGDLRKYKSCCRGNKRYRDLFLYIWLVRTIAVSFPNHQSLSQNRFGRVIHWRWRNPAEIEYQP